MCRLVKSNHRDKPREGTRSAASDYINVLREVDWKSVIEDVYLDESSVSTADRDALYGKLYARTRETFRQAQRAAFDSAKSILTEAAYAVSVDTWKNLVGQKPDALAREHLRTRCDKIGREEANSLIDEWPLLILPIIHALILNRLHAIEDLSELTRHLRQSLAGRGSISTRMRRREEDALATGRSRGANVAAAAVGALQKAWTTQLDERVCPICAGNAAQGRIGMSEDFSSGHSTPPAHPNCRCRLTYFLG